MNSLFIQVGNACNISTKRFRCILETFNVDKAYAVVVAEDDIKDFTEITEGTLYYWDIIKGDYSNLPVNEVALDDKILLSMSQWDTEILYMIGRHGRRFDSFEKRRVLYYRHLKYWYSFLTDKEIDFVFINSIPHEIYDYVIYRLCNVLGIKVCLGDVLTIYDREFEEKRIYMPDMYYGTQQFKDAYNKTKESCDKEELSDEMKPLFEYYLNLVEKKQITLNKLYGDPRKDELDRYYPRPKIGSIFKSGNIIKGTGQFCRHFLSSQYGRIETRQLINYYKKLAKEPDYSKKYIYVPLQYTPECTSNPQGGGMYADMTIMIDILSHSIPDDMKIYVKEHPIQISFGRDKEFYDRLLSIDKVELIKEDCDRYKLMKNAVAISALTGSAGIEGQFLGIPFIMFGYYVSIYAPGTIHVRTVKDCKEAIKRILNKEIKWDIDDLKVYFKFIDNVCIKQYTCSDQEYADYLYRVYCGDNY